VAQNLSQNRNINPLPAADEDLPDPQPRMRDNLSGGLKARKSSAHGQSPGVSVREEEYSALKARNHWQD